MLPVRWSERWTEEGRALQPPGLLSAISNFSAVPGGIGMHGGLPHPSTFPFDEIACLSRGSNEIRLLGKAAEDAQQYIFRPHGYAPLVQDLEMLNRRMHRPYNEIKCALTNGATQAIDCLVNLLLERGDALLCEEFCYSHALEAQFVPRGLELVPIPMDAEGLNPAAMDAIMTARQEAGLKLPKVLYTIPRCQNPTGATMSLARLNELYRVAQKWDVVVLEDDAYYWLQQPSDEGGAVKGLDLEPGLLSMDVDGRVIRIDTLSKLLGPGFRLGWVTATPEVTDKLALAAFSSSMGAASLSQVAIHELLTKWGMTGLDSFVKATQQHYTRLAAKHHAAALKHLSGAATWQRPRAGMFMWLKLLGGVECDKLLASCLEHGVMIVPGRSFWAGGIARTQLQGGLPGQKPLPCPYFRISFASLAEESIDEGYMRLRTAIDTCAPAMDSRDFLDWMGQGQADDLEEEKEISILLQQQGNPLPWQPFDRKGKNATVRRMGCYSSSASSQPEADDQVTVSHISMPTRTRQEGGGSGAFHSGNQSGPCNVRRSLGPPALAHKLGQSQNVRKQMRQSWGRRI